MENKPLCKKFLILGSARTGSTFLMSMLSAHSHIKMYGELFNLDKLSRTLLVEVLANPVSYLSKRINRVQEGEIQVVGFKIFYDHLTEGYFDKIMDRDQAASTLSERLKEFDDFISQNYSRQDLLAKFQKTWEFILEDTSIKVIHLKRRNKLETLVSLKTAFLTDQWMLLKGKNHSETVFPLTHDECVSYFNKMDTYEQTYHSMFNQHPVLDVTYEALVEGKDEVTAEIFNFLELPYAPVSTIMKKQNVSPLSQTVENFEALRESFKTSKWEQFFCLEKD